MNLKPREAKRIIYNGRRYTLHSPWKDLGGGVSEGPFYSRKDVAPADWAYQPDSAYLSGISSTVTNMHCVQQRPITETPRPTT